MLTPYLPYPLFSGGQIRTYNLLKSLSKKHDIILYSFIRSEKEKQYIPSLKPFCKEVRVFMKRSPWALNSLLLSGVTFYPLVVCLYLNREVKNAIEQAIRRDQFDLIHAETFYVMPNIPPNSIPTILVEQTIEYLVYKHYTETVQIPPIKWLMQYDVLKIKKWEQTFWKKATRVVAMSEADKSEMLKLVPNISVDLVPNGVNSDFFKIKNHNNKRRQKTVLFVGNFKWLQNREAVKILIEEIWPKIIKEIPDSLLWIVGRSPPKEIIALNSNNIKVSSNILNIQDAYKLADVLLAPIYGPGGTRYKILESMASGLPVVTTSIGIEGLGAHNGKEALIGENSNDLAKKTIQVLTNPELYKKLVVNARTFVEAHYNWGTISDSLDRIYQEAANDK